MSKLVSTLNKDRYFFMSQINHKYSDSVAEYMLANQKVGVSTLSQAVSSF